MPHKLVQSDLSAPAGAEAAPGADAGPGAASGSSPEAGNGSAVDGKLASRVARRIEADIVRAGWPVGRMLGSENELRERYGISRSVLREAIRLLEHHQVGKMRRGPGGGFFVTALDSGPATRAIVIYLEYLGTGVEDLMYARLLLEPLAAAGAARRAGEDDIGLLRQALDQERSREWEPGIEAHDSLHPLLGQISGNPALQLFVHVLTRFTERYADDLRRLSRSELDRTQAGAAEAHSAIVESVIAGDADHASNHMARHIESVTGWLGDHQRRRSFTHLNRPPAAADLQDAKLSEVLASRIHEEIAYRGWPIGEVLGSEPDLLARYQVSRAALREAVRILEYHSVAAMRRGPGGGLVVTVPDPAASIETMALYLDYQKVSVEDLRVVREAIELGCIDRVIARRHEPGVADRLRAALQVDASTPPADINRLSHVLHTELGELSGNPVLALFLRIVTDLAYRHAHAHAEQQTSADRDISDEEAATAAGRIHGRIVEAILEGDSGLARHRMRRHLEAITAWWH
jgi:DNA-binding FadR family transcriptional regulator